MYKHILLIILIGSTYNVFSQAEEHHTPDQLIIRFNTESGLAPSKEILNRELVQHVQLATNLEIQNIESIGNSKSKLAVITFNASVEPLLVAHQLEASPIIEFAEPNYIAHGAGVRGTHATIPTDSYFDRQYNMLNDGTFGLGNVSSDADVDMELAWDIEKGDSNIVIAVLDAGTKLDHPEFQGRLWINPNESMNGLDTDNNGFRDDINGWDFANNDRQPIDDQGHGTNVAGIICARSDNNLGYAGADWHAKLMTCKVLDANNSGQYSWLTDAIYYAVDNGADLINMSLGGSGFSLAMKQAADYAYVNGVTIVACMMNFNSSVPYYPAAYTTTIAVGSTDPDDKRTSPFFWSASSGSSFGNHIDVCAPGNFIYGLSHSSNTNYESYWGGTSQSSPLVCGISALLLAQDTSRGPDEIRTILRSTAEDEVGRASEDISGFDIYHGYGRVNAYAALNLSSVSIQERQLSQIEVYPNPAQNEVRFSGIEHVNQIIFYSQLGVQMKNLSIQNTEETTVDIADLAAGQYHIQFINSVTGKSWSKLLVISQ